MSDATAPREASSHAASKTNVLLLGSGAREHALAWKLRQSPSLGELWTDSPKNPGLAALCRPADYQNIGRDTFPIENFCTKHRIGLVVIGPEEPLAAGLADALLGQRSAGEGIILNKARPGMSAEEATNLVIGGTVMNAAVQNVFGPVKAAARLEADKAFAKQLMRDASIPTADARVFTDASNAKDYIASRTDAYVIKAAGLAKGKGVFLPDSQADAANIIDRIMIKKEFGDAGNTVLIEERLKGREVSVFALIDGRNILLLDACQDHKRLLDNARGPNTGGMGALCPARAIDERIMDRVLREVLVPTVDALRREGVEYRGVLYVGLMLTPAGPKVLEYNVRFGDPECQVLMARMECDLVKVMLATSGGASGKTGAGQGLDSVEIGFKPGASVCIVLAAPGYPDDPKPGVPIHGVELAERVPDVQVFHAGTRIDERGQLVTARGRVLSVTAHGATVDEARQKAYHAADMIEFAGKQMRRDIGTDVVG
ncbi:MAG: phosphoribosylamine--glycine ligase [Phycisphaerales bacterium]|nr:phosphoribosylamine--glycine ligase [Phycisphaerales bacterium]